MTPDDKCIECKKPLSKFHPDHSRFVARGQRTKRHPHNTTNLELRTDRCDLCYVKQLHNRKLEHNYWGCSLCNPCGHAYVMPNCANCRKHAQAIEAHAKAQMTKDRKPAPK